MGCVYLIHTHLIFVCIELKYMPKYRKNFTLSVHTLKLLDEVENKSEMIDNAVEFYLNNNRNMKVSGDVPAKCPECKHDFKHKAQFDIDKLEVKQLQTAETSNPSTTTQTTVQVEKPKPEVIVKTQTPAHIPSFKCKDDNCGLMHKNPNHTKQIKGKCTNCGQFTGDVNSECPFCNQKEYDDLSQDDLDDLGIPKPLEKEHDHESE